MLKPVETARLEKTLKKLQQTQYQPPPHLPLEMLVKQLQLKKEIKTLTVKIGDKILLIKLGSIIYIEAEEKNMFFCIQWTAFKNTLTDFTITSLEEKLPEAFVRIHRGTIINTDYIKEIRKGFNGAFVFVMNNAENTRITSSRSNGETLRERFGI